MRVISSTVSWLADSNGFTSQPASSIILVCMILVLSRFCLELVLEFSVHDQVVMFIWDSIDILDGSICFSFGFSLYWCLAEFWVCQDARICLSEWSSFYLVRRLLVCLCLQLLWLQVLVKNYMICVNVWISGN